MTVIDKEINFVGSIFLGVYIFLKFCHLIVAIVSFYSLSISVFISKVTRVLGKNLFHLQPFQNQIFFKTFLISYINLKTVTFCGIIFSYKSVFERASMCFSVISFGKLVENHQKLFSSKCFQLNFHLYLICM